MSETRTVPTVAEMIAFGRSLGLGDGAIRKTFHEATGLHRTEGWQPSEAACRAWARVMEQRAKDAGLQPAGWGWRV